jgi:long-chain fatty acid transport protein
MHATLRLSLAAALLAAASPAVATNGMRMIGFGPVQNSMGGASVAAPLDATTLVTNPAGMSGLAPRLDLSGTAFAPTVQYEAQWQLPGMPGAAGAGQESERTVDVIPTFASVYRVQDELTLGVAALGTAGMGVSYPAGSDGLYTMRSYTNYMNLRVAPAAAYRLTDALSVGVAVNFQYAQLGYEAAGMPQRETGGAMGIGASVGVTFQATKALTLAAAYESQSYFQEFEFDVPGHTTPFGQPVPGGTEKLAFDQPMVATLCASVRPLEWLLLAADVEWINWSATNGQDLPEFTTPQEDSGYMPWNLDWSDQWVYKIGAQVLVPGVKGLAVRAGYNYGASPLSEDRAFENVAFPAIAEHHFSLGAGYDFGAWSVNVAGQYSPEATLEGSNPGQGIVAYRDTMSQLVFDLGMSYRF